MSAINTYTMNSGVFQEFLALIGRMVHGQLVRQIEYLKAENQILRSKLGRCINLKASEKRRLVKFGLPLGGSIKDFISSVSYTTFRRWVNNGIHSKARKKIKQGRPRKTTKEIRELVVRLARENNWGYTRILGELKKLGICSFSRNTVRNILIEYGLDPAPKRGEDTWDDFIKRHFKTLWASDFFTKTVWTMLGPKIFHVLFFINVHTRKVYIAGATENPTKEWVAGKAKTLSFLFETGKASSQKLLLRDGDKKYSSLFDQVINNYGVQVKKIPYRSPNLNPHAEGFVSVIKKECLNYFFVFGERHLRYLLKVYLKYYNTVRPHNGKGNVPLEYKPTKGGKGKIKCDSKLGGIIKHYYRN